MRVLRAMAFLCLLVSSAIANSVFAGEAQKAPTASAAGASVAVEFSAEPLGDGKDRQGETVDAGDAVRIRFRITDSRSDYGLADLHPGSWLMRRGPGQEKPDKKACESQIRTLLRGGLSYQADVDLNGFYILTLNADNSIAIVNPQVNLSTANVVGVVPIKDQVADWVFDEQSALAYVTTPDAGQVVVVDVNRRNIVKRLAAGKGAGDIARQPDGRYLWISNDEAGSVSVIDVARVEVVKTLQVGSGPFEFAFDRKGHYVYVTSRDGAVRAIRVSDWQAVARKQLAKGALHAAYSVLSDMLYVANETTGKLTVLTPQNGKVVASIDLDLGVKSLHATPDGRYVLALNTQHNQVSVIDSAGNRLIRNIRTGKQPDRIEFGGAYAYIHHRGDANITMVQITSIEAGESQPVVTIPFGQLAPEQAPALAAVSPVAVMPEGGGALVVNPAEKIIYFYMDGMMAPSGSFKIWTDRPLGAIVWDRSLAEGVQTGDYETIVRIEKPGVYDVPFFLPSPLVATCFELKVAGTEEPVEQRIKPVVVSKFSQGRYQPGQPATLRFELRDEATGQAISDVHNVRILTFKKGNHWQSRQSAKVLGAGQYEAQVTFPTAGNYYVFFSAPSLGIRFGDIQYYSYATVGDDARPQQPAKSIGSGKTVKQSDKNV